MNRFVPWLRELAEHGGKGAVNNIDARAIGRVADELERLSQDRNAADSGQICSGGKMKIELELTPAEAGKFLRQMAEMTTRNSQNWDNYEAIATSMLKSAFDHVPVFISKEGAGPTTGTANVDGFYIPDGPKGGL